MIIRICIFAVFASLGATALPAQMTHGHGHLHGADGTGHDEMTMPGLRGRDATLEESAELALMFRNFDKIEREVENLPNGIRTVTVSDDPVVMDALVNHTVGMIDRVGQKRDPQVIIQSPTLDIFFERSEAIQSFVEITDEGLVVIQTSEDPEVVAALHVHAAEVTAMAEQGMHAVHQMMMQRSQDH
ncbi:hypothetical protein [Pacificoceanicola onchidii]|uniref:hypothetical protein n=1 Tax=Pacificoceanicola onchidii TaxID=2562685 RepID=UPI001F0E6428|nr:hypothetical protein [Pacificoceanicola onchidii]